MFSLLNLIRDWLVGSGLYDYIGAVDGLFNQLQFRALASVAMSMVIVMALGRRVIAQLTRMKVGDAGLSDAEALRAHSASKAHTPTMGGVLIAGSIVATCLFFGDLANFYMLVGLVVVIWLAVLGGFDDWLKLTAATRGQGSRQGLYAWEKLVFQLGLGLLVGYFLFRHGDTPQELDIAHVVTLPLQRTYDPTAGYAIETGLLYLPRLVFIAVAVMMIAGMSNAVNITDGMDGLTTGITAVVSVGLLVLVYISGTEQHAQTLLVPYIPGSEEATVLAGAMLGACLGFLWFNCSPAQVFMGDTGSLCLGGLIAYIGIVARQELVVLVMCGVFLLEIGSVVVQVGYFKMSGGKRVFRCAPYHHHLHLGGWTEQKVVVRAWIISILLVVGGIASLKLR
jgi:phospho-N-acetylmuramoyl-pentapeptide-transferase